MGRECVTELGPLRPGDLPLAARIAATAPDPWRGEDLSAALSDGRRVCLVARADGVLEGFICFRVLHEEAELEMLAVAPEARRQGAGRALVRAGLVQCKQRGAIRCLLELRAGNTPALKLYQSLGFTVLATRPAMFAGPREDGLCMELAL